MLLSLPRELLAHVLSYLRPFEVERVARTFNKTLTPLCIPLLATRATAFRNARAITARFIDLRLDADGALEAAYARAGLADDYGPFSAPALADQDLFTAFDHLALDGDLHWLAPLDERTAKEMARYHPPQAAASAARMAALEKTVCELGLKLPKCFARFMTDHTLQTRVPSYGAAYFVLGDLVKLRGGGYVIKFYSDQQGW
jgi:hypothetical protein